MVAYQFYWHDETGKYHLIGVLPERRSDPIRITRESVLNWAEIVIGDTLDTNSLYFVQIEV